MWLYIFAKQYAALSSCEVLIEAAGGHFTAAERSRRTAGRGRGEEE